MEDEMRTKDDMRLDFLMEYRLHELDPVLHQKFKDCVSTMYVMLDHYMTHFPAYTDHSMRHALNVIRFCNHIIGYDNIGKMDAGEIYVLLMGIYFHDVGMGINDKDYHEIMLKLEGEDYIRNHTHEEHIDNIRKYHHELSAEFVRKYAMLFELGDEKYVEAIAQVARGHRVTDLMNEESYPIHYELDNKEQVCLPYLASLTRLADEIDVGRDRNPEYYYTDDNIQKEVHHFARHGAIRTIRIEKDAFVLEVDGPEEVIEDIVENRKKMQKVLDECRTAVNGRTKYVITQEQIRIERV